MAGHVRLVFPLSAAVPGPCLVEAWDPGQGEPKPNN